MTDIQERRPNCPHCGGALWKLGTTGRGKQKHLCRECRKRVTEGAFPRQVQLRVIDREMTRLFTRRSLAIKTSVDFISRMRAALDMPPLTEEEVDQISDLMIVAEAARRSGYSDEYVRQLVEAGRLSSLQIGPYRFVHLSSLITMRNTKPSARRRLFRESLL